MRRLIFFSLLLLGTALTGCDLFGDSAEKVAAAKEAEGRAIGSACRHAGRAIEDCYALNRKADKASVFAGWRDMNDYMRENKIDEVSPQINARVRNAESRGGEPRSGDVSSDSPASIADSAIPEKRVVKPIRP